MANPKLTQIAMVASVLISLVTLTAAQQSTPQAPWSGWARCEINVSGQGYRDQQTHTWTISSSTSAVSGAFRIYPATWSVAGSGSLQHTQGNQTLMAQWATSAQNLSAPLAVFVRASDRKMFIQARHSQARAPRSVNGYQQLTGRGLRVGVPRGRSVAPEAGRPLSRKRIERAPSERQGGPYAAGGHASNRVVHVAVRARIVRARTPSGSSGAGYADTVTHERDPVMI
jgi:hypothetical protein